METAFFFSHTSLSLEIACEKTAYSSAGGAQNQPILKEGKHVSFIRAPVYKAAAEESVYALACLIQKNQNLKPWNNIFL